VTHLQQASDAIDARAGAVADVGLNTSTLDIARLVASGFDFDARELTELAHGAAAQALAAIGAGNCPGCVLASIYIAGVATGAKSQELRRRAEVARS